MAGFTFYKQFKDPIEEVTASDVGPKTVFPVGVDYETVFKWYYRVKVWEFTVVINLSTSVTSTDSAATATLPGPINEDTHLELVSFTSEARFSVDYPVSIVDDLADSDHQEDIGANSSSIADVSYSTSFTSLRFLHNVVTYDELYYPGFIMAMDMSANGQFFAVDGFKTKGRAVSSQYFGETGMTTVPVTIDGINFDVNWFGEDGEGGESTLGSITVNCDFVSITLNPKEYWPYNPGDGGGPVWDQDSGIQLRDPFSVQP